MYKTLTIALILSLISCKEDTKKPLLLGKWKGAAWLVSNKISDRKVEAVSFEFTEGDTYTAQYGDQMEKGTYALKGDKLYTTADAANKIEKMVKLTVLKPDTLVMDMNRVGTPEQLLLVRP